MWFLLVILFMDTLTWIAGFKEAWGNSQESYVGILKIFGKWKIFKKVLDHAPWIVERGCWVLLVVLTFFLVGDKWQLSVVITSWGAKFMAMHQFSYNWTMVYYKKKGYKMGIAESADTTAEKSASLLKITFFAIGILIPLTYWITTL